MKCPFVIRGVKGHRFSRCERSNAIRRRRECLLLLRRFTTFETVELTFQVHKRDGRYEDFQQQKLINGLESACRHTTISRDRVIAIASEITAELFSDRCVRSAPKSSVRLR